MLTPPVLASAVTFPSLSVWDLGSKTKQGCAATLHPKYLKYNNEMSAPAISHSVPLSRTDQQTDFYIIH